MADDAISPKSPELPRVPGPAAPQRSARSALLLARLGTLPVPILLAAVLAAVVVGAWPTVAYFKLNFFSRSIWSPQTDQLGCLGPLQGSLVSALIAVLLALPVSLGTALFASALGPQWLRRPLGAGFDLLAGIPTVVYGMWGWLVLVPLMGSSVQPWLTHVFGAPFFAYSREGASVLSAALLLALMVLPLMAGELRTVLAAAADRLGPSCRELGATPWEAAWRMLAACRAAVLGTLLLGLAWALAEGVGVSMVIGGVPARTSLLAPGTTLAASIVAEFLLAMSGLHRGALFALGGILCLITLPLAWGGRRLLRAEPRPPAVQAGKTGDAPDFKRLRQLVGLLAVGLSAAATLAALACLGSVLFAVLGHGFGGLSWRLLTAEVPPPPGVGGGLGNAFLGSLALIACSAVLAYLPAVLTASYLLEARARHGDNRLAAALQGACDLLSHVPGIVVGLAIFELVVLPSNHFSALAGALALAVIMLPVLARMEQRLVSSGIRWGKRALCSVLLALVCAGGEAAPLLFTALNDPFYNLRLLQPIASVPVNLRNLALSPYIPQHQLAWSGALVLTASILLAALLLGWLAGVPLRELRRASP